jgi:serine protease Do
MHLSGRYNPFVMRLTSTVERLRITAVLVLTLTLGACSTRHVMAEVPTTQAEVIAELTEVQARSQAVISQVTPAVVGLRVRREDVSGAGSGVIISPDGYVLTAGHVSGTPNVEVDVYLSDGRAVKGRTLGRNGETDTGMLKIESDGPFPYINIAPGGSINRGQWVVAIGHPGGYQRPRGQVVRVGRVLTLGDMIRTDAVLVGGDSGGPLFDLDARLVGIHSRIGQSTERNLHVSMATFEKDWPRLAAGEEWGVRSMNLAGMLRRSAWLGVSGEPAKDGFRITVVAEQSPAEAAGLQRGDVILSFKEQPVKTQDALRTLVQGSRVGEEVVIQVRRGEAIESLRARLQRMPQG